MCAVVQRLATDAFHENTRMVGPSACAGCRGNGSNINPEKALGELAGQQCSDLLSPSQNVREKILCQQIESLNPLIERDLAGQRDSDRRIVELWLDGYSYRDIAEKIWGERNKNHWTIKALTFKFKSSASFSGIADDARDEFKELEARCPGLLDRLIDYSFEMGDSDRCTSILRLRRPMVILADERTELK
jgi:hypothetical protein